MLGAYKKHPQAYLLYVEDCFLLSDNADPRIFSKDTKKDYIENANAFNTTDNKDLQGFLQYVKTGKITTDYTGEDRADDTDGKTERTSTERIPYFTGSSYGCLRRR